jgi:hypothetical protein
MMTGTLKRDRASPAPWEYRGELMLPAGRTCFIEARVVGEPGNKFFELRGALVPGLSAVELEAALVEIERTAAERIIREGRSLADLPDDEMPF